MTPLRYAVMHEKFWDDVAPDYDAEIFNTLKSDRNGRLGQTIQRLATGKRLTCDFGCGVGRFLPLLLSCSKQVVATDFSAASLEIAISQVKESQREQAEVLKRDLTKQLRKFCSADFGLLINVLIMPNAGHRDSILKNVRTNLKKGAKLVVVVPSLESAMFTYSRLVDWHQREGATRRAAENAVNRDAAAEMKSIASGTVLIDGTPTKHFLAEELVTLLAKHKFSVVERDKVEYDWIEDFDDPPSWLKAPYPWDWLFVVEKK